MPSYTSPTVVALTKRSTPRQLALELLVRTNFRLNFQALFQPPSFQDVLGSFPVFSSLVPQVCYVISFDRFWLLRNIRLLKHCTGLHNTYVDFIPILNLFTSYDQAFGFPS